MWMFVGMKIGLKTLLFAHVVAVVGSILTSVYMLDLWTWFVVPLGVPSIKLWHAYGLYSLAYLLTSNSAAVPMVMKLDILTDSEREATQRESALYVGYTFVLTIVMPFLTYLASYAAHRLG